MIQVTQVDVLEVSYTGDQPR